MQISFRVKQDPNYLTHWDSSNDYSRENLTSEYVTYKNVPVYLHGEKVYGEEPPRLAPTPTPTNDPGVTPVNNASIKVSYKCGKEDGTKNTIRAAINIKNTGTTAINLSDIKVRYWFTKDDSEQNSLECEYAVCGTENVIGKVSKIDNPVANADTYCEIGFTKDAGKLAPNGTTGDIPFRIESSISEYDQTDDYSFNPDMKELGDNSKITAYVMEELKYGIEPVKTSSVIVGDLNGSGSVDSTDYSIMKRYLLGILDIDSKYLKAADVNGDGSINSTDYALMKRYLLGILTSF